jgi:hypothetical protein
MTSTNETVQPVNAAIPPKRRVMTLTIGNTKLLLPEEFPSAKLIDIVETLAEAQVLDYQYTAKGSIYYPANEVEVTAGFQTIVLVESAAAANLIGGTL